VWIWAALLIGAVVTVGWAWFIFGFIHEPSVVGRILLVMVSWIGISVSSGIAGAISALGLLRNEVWGRPLAWVAAIAMTLTGVGAIAGIPALIGLGASRKGVRP
jgi:hypothetical protein